MTVVSIKNELAKAREGRYAVPLFDVFDAFAADGLFESVVERRAPTIFGIYSSAARSPKIAALAAYIAMRCKETDVPCSIMLDHGESEEQCLQMLDYGFSDVMYDGSALPLEENIANTRRVVVAAHARGAAVEAELGHVGLGEEYDSYGGQAMGFTDPDQVERFVAETGVDFLALAFGNAHGPYKGEPKLDLALVEEIRRRVTIPLVMHGGTGLSDEQFSGAIQAGIAKINFATSIIRAAGDNMKKAAGLADASMFTISDGIRLAYYEQSARMYGVFGTAGKA